MFSCLYKRKILLTVLFSVTYLVEKRSKKPRDVRVACLVCNDKRWRKSILLVQCTASHSIAHAMNRRVTWKCEVLMGNLVTIDLIFFDQRRGNGWLWKVLIRMGKTLDNNEREQVADQRFSLKTMTYWGCSFVRAQKTWFWSFPVEIRILTVYFCDVMFDMLEK